MKHLLLSFAILLPVIASADVVLKKDENSYRANHQAIFTGEDAIELKSFVGKKPYLKNTLRGVQGISCQEEECQIKFNGDVYSKLSGHESIQREDINLNRFFETFTPNENDLLVSIPSGAWFFHARDEVLESDRALYKFLSSRKAAEQGELNGSKTVSIEGRNFKLSCMKLKKPERYEMAKCIPHGGCLPSIFSKFIRITHECRSYLKASPK